MNIHKIVLENCPGGVLHLDRQLRIIYANPEIARILGTPTEAESKNFGAKITDLITSKSAPNFLEMLARLANGESFSVESSFISVYGKETVLNIRGSAVNENGVFTGAVLLLLDISVQKNSGTASKHNNEDYLRYLINSMPDFVCYKDGAGRWMEANEYALKVFNLTGKDFRGKKDRELAEEDEFFHDAFMACEISDEKAWVNGRQFRVEEMIPQPDGHPIFFDVIKSPLFYPDGGKQGLLVIGRDITDRKKTMEERNIMATAVDQLAEAIIITDIDGFIQYTNPAFEKITGYTHAEVMGQNANILKSGKHDDAFYAEMWGTILSGKVWNGRLTNRKKDGSLYEEDTTISPIKDSSDKVINFIGIKRDVTKEKMLERQFRQARKMEAIGTLAGGIAHDFNNILSAILGFAEVALDSLPEGSEAREDIMEVVNASYRAKNLVRQILTFSRKGEQELKPLSMCVIVKESLKLLRAILPKNIEIREDIETDCGFVMADPTQLSQVIMNLCANANHAMLDKGGALSVSLKPVEIDTEMAASQSGLKPGAYTRLSVSDTGRGMDKDTLERMFEPFFTTKEPGEGTGLGLATAHGIVTNHNGAITVYSEIGKGSTFFVYLPRIEGRALGKEAPRAKIEPAGNERILFVDDEESIIKVFKKGLERLGYTVDARINPMEAFEVFRANPENFDLVITDHTMPNMNGTNLAAKIMGVRAGTPVILITGLGTFITLSQAHSIGIRDLVLKPISTRDLAESIRRTLDHPRD